MTCRREESGFRCGRWRPRPPRTPATTGRRVTRSTTASRLARGGCCNTTSMISATTARPTATRSSRMRARGGARNSISTSASAACSKSTRATISRRARGWTIISRWKRRPVVSAPASSRRRWAGKTATLPPAQRCFSNARCRSRPFTKAAGWAWNGGGMSLRAAWLARTDLNADANGSTVAGRAVYTPVRRAGEVVHLGVSASREQRDGFTARVSARPEVALTPVRLIDTGTLRGVDHIDRAGLEAGWLAGPLLLQSEYLMLRAQRPAARGFTSHGGYVFAAWLLTGETHGYRDSGFIDPVPVNPCGALELALRFSTLDLDDAGVTGGRERDWTLGLNWYFERHFKLQANYIRAFSNRGNLHLDPRILALRAQLAF